MTAFSNKDHSVSRIESQQEGRPPHLHKLQKATGWGCSPCLEDRQTLQEPWGISPSVFSISQYKLYIIYLHKVSEILGLCYLPYANTGLTSQKPATSVVSGTIIITSLFYRGALNLKSLAQPAHNAAS